MPSPQAWASQAWRFSVVARRLEGVHEAAFGHHRIMSYYMYYYLEE